jgi:hypothetical protein
MLWPLKSQGASFYPYFCIKHFNSSLTFAEVEGFFYTNFYFVGFILKWKTQNENATLSIILKMDFQSQSNPPNWISIWTEQSINQIQQHPEHWLLYPILQT